MKVLKKGRPQKGWSKEFECTGAGNRGGGCGALLLVSEWDLFHTQSSALHETTSYATFQCPECGVWTDAASEYGGDRDAMTKKKHGSHRAYIKYLIKEGFALPPGIDPQKYEDND